MHVTVHVAIKEWVQNLEEVDIVFRGTLTHKQNLQSNNFCWKLCESNKHIDRVCVSKHNWEALQLQEELPAPTDPLKAGWCNMFFC